MSIDCMHLAQSTPGGEKSLINSCVCADILLSHTDRHTQINSCIKYSLKCLLWRKDSRTNTLMCTHTYMRTWIPGKQLVLPHKSSLPHPTWLQVQIKFVLLHWQQSLIIMNMSGWHRGRDRCAQDSLFPAVKKQIKGIELQSLGLLFFEAGTNDQINNN